MEERREQKVAWLNSLDASSHDESRNDSPTRQHSRAASVLPWIDRRAIHLRDPAGHRRVDRYVCCPRQRAPACRCGRVMHWRPCCTITVSATTGVVLRFGGMDIPPGCGRRHPGKHRRRGTPRNDMLQSASCTVACTGVAIGWNSAYFDRTNKMPATPR
jgi:hypothetical protein